MRRGDIYWVNFDPAMGSEITKQRPAVIVSNNISNSALSRVQVVPITSNTTKVYPCETLISVKDRLGKAMADQITTVDKLRIGKMICILTANELKQIDKILKLQLEL